ELGNRQRRMGVVELNRYFVRKAIEGTQPDRAIVHLVALLVAANDVLERGRDKEVFLSQPELTADEDVVVWIEHTADVLRAGARFDGADVVALVELVEIELLDGAGTPQAQSVHRLRPIPGDRGVERGGEDVTGVDPCV